jgi:hypothetical protein
MRFHVNVTQTFTFLFSSVPNRDPQQKVPTLDQASQTTDEAGDMGCYALVVVGVVVVVAAAAAAFVEVPPPISVRTHCALKDSF